MECGATEYPIYCDSAVIGKLRIIKDGLYRRLDASCAMRDGVIRLWLAGEDKTSYIGVMVPHDGHLVLKKAYSRTEAAALPEIVIRAVAGEYAPEQSTPRRKETSADQPWRAGRGCIYRRDGNTMLIAIPTELSQDTRGTRIATVNGRRYIIFRY